MSYELSGCVFVRNTFSGAYMLPESLAQFLPFCDEIVIMDLGSDDGTIEFLREIAAHNHKIKVILEGSFPYEDAGVFAALANDLIERWCTYPNILYWQSDEIWHEDLLKQMEERLNQGQFDLSFWRIQYKYNFQAPKWYPHLIHRVGQKGRFNFVGDGMNTDRTWDAKICSNYGGEYFPKWGAMGEEGIKPYVNEMVTDISLIGGFRDNIPARRRMHAPFWHEEPTIPDFNGIHKPESVWIEEAKNDPRWTMKTSPYNLPKILRWHVGRTKYELRPELLEAIKSNTTQEYMSGI